MDFLKLILGYRAINGSEYEILEEKAVGGLGGAAYPHIFPFTPQPSSEGPKGKKLLDKSNSPVTTVQKKGY
jgi:hypothetical protein